MKYVVDFEVYTPFETLRSLGQQDVDSFPGLTLAGHREFVATLIAAQILLRDGDRIVVTAIRPA